MKKRVLITITVVMTAAALVFCALWLSAARGESGLELLARSGANEAYTRFSDYRESDSDGDYYGGVAGFRVFQEAYVLLSDETDSTERLVLNDVYGGLLISPDLSEEDIDELTEIMRLLSENVRDIAVFQRLADFRGVFKG